MKTAAEPAAGEVPRALEAALAALGDMSFLADSPIELPPLLGRICRNGAQHLGARRVAFWRLEPSGVLVVQPDPYGFKAFSPVYEVRIGRGPYDAELVDGVIGGVELDLDRGTAPSLDGLWHRNGLIDVKSSIAVAWRAGERPVGLFAAYDSRRGFNRDDVSFMRVVAIGAGLVWQYRKAQRQLGQTAARLEDAVSARRQLLNNIAAGGDEARRRFASALQDDSLQFLTAAELQVERMRYEAVDGRQTQPLEQLQSTLRTVEDSLRRLLTNVSPGALELRPDLDAAIRERLESLRLNAGIESHINLRFPQQVSRVIETIVLKNVNEALTNVERHAHATRVLVAAEPVDGGLRVEVTDDGTGFVVGECVHMPGRVGLQAIHERVHLAGGWCRFASEPGAGAKVEFWVPSSE